jgi:hypothetical protein
VVKKLSEFFSEFDGVNAYLYRRRNCPIKEGSDPTRFAVKLGNKADPSKQKRQKAPANFNSIAMLFFLPFPLRLFLYCLIHRF